MYAKLCATVAASMFLVAAIPARADTCMRLNGDAFSGDIGFFRFAGDLPTHHGDMVALQGRAAGVSPVWGSAVVAKDGSYLELGAMFFIDGVQGQIDVTFVPPRSKSGSGSGDYGQYGNGSNFTATIVKCVQEP